MKLMMRKSYFTLVEVLIAMGICVVGVVAIMGLFPVGASASRDAVMVGQTKDAATMILKFYKYCVENGKDAAFQELTGWTAINDTTTYSSKTAPQLTEDTSKQVGDLSYVESDYLDLDGNKLGGIDISSLLSAASCQIQQHKQLKETPEKGVGVYLIKFVSRISEDSTDTVDDTFSIVKTWVTPVTIPKNESDTSEPIIPRLVSFNVEVSWPAELPYEKRQREFYSIDVFSPVTN